jgi:hypothetical protein
LVRGESSRAPGGGYATLPGIVAIDVTLMHRSLSGILIYPSIALTLAIVAITLPAQAQVRSPASAFPDRQPESISPDVANAFAKLIPLTTTARQQKMLKDEQAAWLASRNSHCRALAAAESGTGTANADVRAACLASMDKQRWVALQRMRLSLSLAMPRMPRSDPQRVAPVIRRDNAHTTYGLHVSPIGGLAVAVTAGDRAHNRYELYDLASGLALRTFAPERGSGLATGLGEGCRHGRSTPGSCSPRWTRSGANSCFPRRGGMCISRIPSGG